MHKFSIVGPHETKRNQFQYEFDCEDGEENDIIDQKEVFPRVVTKCVLIHERQ